MIPQAKQTAVARGLREAFGVSEFEDIQKLHGGLSIALVYRVVALGKPYLLRLLMRTDAYSDPTGEFACMKSASEGGVAPRIWYANPEDRILITDFVEAKPFPVNQASLLAMTLRRLHALPRFPKVVNYFAAIDGFIRRFQTAKMLPESETEELFRQYAEVLRVYPRNESELVSSHNDLKPQNILFDGERIWLVDWEAAFLNDRYFDLAVAANFFIKDEAQEASYLAEYLGEPAGEYRSARFYLMRQILHMSYAMCFMVLANAKGASLDQKCKTPGFEDFHERIISGEIDLASPEAKMEYGKVHLNRLIGNLQAERFRDALAEVSRFHANT